MYRKNTWFQAFPGGPEMYPPQTLVDVELAVEYLVYRVFGDWAKQIFQSACTLSSACEFHTSTRDYQDLQTLAILVGMQH